MGKLIIEHETTGSFVISRESSEFIARQAEEVLKGPILLTAAIVHLSIHGHLRDNSLQPYVEVMVERVRAKGHTESMNPPYGRPFTVTTLIRMSFYTRLNPVSREPDITSVFCDQDGCHYVRFPDWGKAFETVLQVAQTIPPPPAYGAPSPFGTSDSSR